MKQTTAAPSYQRYRCPAEKYCSRRVATLQVLTTRYVCGGTHGISGRRAQLRNRSSLGIVNLKIGLQNASEFYAILGVCNQ